MWYMGLVQVKCVVFLNSEVYYVLYGCVGSADVLDSSLLETTVMFSKILQTSKKISLFPTICFSWGQETFEDVTTFKFLTKISPYFSPSELHLKST